MRYVLMYHHTGTKIVQVEDDPAKILDIIMDEYNLEKDPKKKKAIRAAMKKHAKHPTIFIDQKFEPIPYDPNLHWNLVKDGATIGERIL